MISDAFPFNLLVIWPSQLWLLAAVCFGTWILGVITKDTSWVDRIWSIVPIGYAWLYAAAANFVDPRINLMAVLVTLWGARLTFNFARKGGYQPGGEDYRWEVLRQQMTAWQYQVFNIVFIVLIQNVILFLIVTPVGQALRFADTTFGVIDVAWAALFLGFLALETTADQQQWNFHQRKKQQLAAGVSPDPKFLQSGLFAISRHPNFFSEQAQWWVLYLWAASVSGVWLGWFALGAVTLTALFIGSTRFTEDITLGKYPEYAEYQKKVSALIPWFPRR